MHGINEFVLGILLANQPKSKERFWENVFGEKKHPVDLGQF